MAFTQDDVMRFISHLTKRGDEGNLPYTLHELADILEAAGTEKQLVDMVRHLSTVNVEAAELRMVADLTPEQVRIAIRRGKQRIKREEEERRRSHC